MVHDAGLPVEPLPAATDISGDGASDISDVDDPHERIRDRDVDDQPASPLPPSIRFDARAPRCLLDRLFDACVGGDDRTLQARRWITHMRKQIAKGEARCSCRAHSEFDPDRVHAGAPEEKSRPDRNGCERSSDAAACATGAEIESEVSR